MCVNRVMLPTLALMTLICAALAADDAPKVNAPKPDAAKTPATPFSSDGNRLAYLDHVDPYYPHRDFAKLITPQWVGEEGVEAVVILSIDDMRDPARYENYLRPILDRLKKIDGRAPLSIFTNSVGPQDPQLQAWLKEGLSFEIHTLAHPCPLLERRGMEFARETYHGCVDLVAQIPNQRGRGPVAFRMPCCDSMNSVSPRFYAEIFNKVSEKKNFLAADSSVFMLYTANDPALPRELVFEDDGQTERFRKYLPKGKGFVNYIEDYPYPYVIGNTCWQFPVTIPSDWEAQHRHGVNNDKTVEDWKAALDATVIKQGVMTMCFHPHGWIKAEQIVELIDHAVAKHGKKVKFLNFNEAVERLNKNLLSGSPLDNFARVIDADGDGLMDVVLGTTERQHFRRWDKDAAVWKTQDGEQPFRMWKRGYDDGVARFGLRKGGEVLEMIGYDGYDHLYWRSDGVGFQRFGVKVSEHPALKGVSLHGEPIITAYSSVRFRDIDRDGEYDIVYSTGKESAIFRRVADGSRWEPVPFKFPEGIAIDEALAFVDLNGDGRDDLLRSSDERVAVYLYESDDKGWTRKLFDGARDRLELAQQLPPLARDVWRNNGFFIKDRALYWMNEDTGGKEEHHVKKITFDELLAAGKAAGDVSADAPPLSPRQALKSFEAPPGFRVELVAAEPLVLDPVAYDWGPDGRLWVVEMADYPMGMDAPKTPGEFGKPGGRVVHLTDTDGDGQYDKRTVFLDGLSFPTGVMVWDKGVLVTMAPYVFYAEDKDGDGKADVRMDLFKGFGEGNQQHRVNGLRLGLDNWIHIGNGDSGGSIENLTWHETVDIRGRDTRIRPAPWGPHVSLNIADKRPAPAPAPGSDTWFIDATSGQTQFGRERDDFGNWFGCNNPNPGWHYVLEDRYLRRNPHVAAPSPRVDLTGDRRVFPISHVYSPSVSNHQVRPGETGQHTSANSFIIYRDDFYGPAFAPTVDEMNAFVSEPVFNIVRRMIVKRRGVTFEATRPPVPGNAPGGENREFLASRDVWFRPAMLRIGPDGCLWIADVYRHVIEHPKWIPDEWEVKLDLRAGADRGRIYRVVPVGVDVATPRAAAKLDGSDVKALVAALESANGWKRDMAHMMLLWGHGIDEETRQKLHELEKELLFHYHRADGYSEKLAEIDAVYEKHPTAVMLGRLVHESKRPASRVQALCVLDGLGLLHLKALTAGLNDLHPGVRRRAVRLAEQYVHPSTQFGVGASAKKESMASPGWIDHPRLAEALLSRVEDEDAQVRIQLAYTLGAGGGQRAGEALAKLLLRDGDDPHMRAAIMSSALPHLDALFAAVLKAEDAGKRAALLQALIAMAAKAKQTEALGKAVDAVLKREGAEYAAWQYRAMRELVASSYELTDEQRAAMKAMTDAAYRAAADVKADIDTRVAAIEFAVTQTGDARRDAAAALVADARTPAPVQQAAATALLAQRGDKTITLLLAKWSAYSPALRETIVDALLRSETGAKQLLDAVESRDIDARSIDTPRRQQLLSHKSDAIRRRAEKLLGGPVASDRQKLVDEYRAALTLQGDAARGRAVFEKNCAACHKLAGVGKDIGPSLTTLTDRSAPAPGSPGAPGILESVLDPNRAVEARFLNYIVEIESGEIITGVITSETGASITVVGVDGSPRDILRRDIHELRSTTKSLMPEGLEAAIDKQAMADLIAFIGSAGPPPKKFANNQPRTVTQSDDGALNLHAAAAEVYGPSIIFEQKYRNFGYWHSDQDHAVWTIEVKQGGRYTVELDYALAAAVSTNRFQLTVADQKLSGPVPATGSWDEYVTKKVGEIDLKAGTHRLTFRSLGKVGGALIDLRTITLKPIR